MYTLGEIQVVFMRCTNYQELEKACDALIILIEDGEFTEPEREYLKIQAHVRFRQLNV